MSKLVHAAAAVLLLSAGSGRASLMLPPELRRTPASLSSDEGGTFRI